jgi:hypothetical protein
VTVSAQRSVVRRQVRRTAAVLAMACAFGAWSAAAQETPHEAFVPTDLKVVIVGDGKTRSGHRTGFRIYEAPDGSRGRVTYGRFESPEVAQQEFEEWIKAAQTVTARDQKKSKDGELISDRITGVVESAKSKNTVFLIIKREGLDCYFIESESQQIARHVDGLVGHRDDDRDSKN